MGFDIKNAVFICNHYRKSHYFERTLRMILDLGGRLVVQNTSGPNDWGGLASDIKSRCIYVDAGSSSYDAGMSRFKSSGVVPTDAEIIVLLDNDCFINEYGVKVGLPAYLEEFVEGGYDFVCHSIGEDVNKGNYQPGRQIALAPPITFTDPGADHMPEDIRTSKPYGFENAYLLYSRRAWDSMSPHDLSHHRRVVWKMSSIGAKIGTHRVDDWQWGYTQWSADAGWFHCGNLFPHYLLVEGEQWERWNPESKFCQFRAGFFNAEIREFDVALGGNGSGVATYGAQMTAKISRLNQHMGGAAKVLAAWDELHKEAGFQL